MPRRYRAGPRRHGPARLLTLLAGWVLAGQALALEIPIGYLAWQPDRGPVLSNVIPEPADAGRRGAELATRDSNTTGRFLDRHYRLMAPEIDSPEALLAAARALHDQGVRLFVTRLPEQRLAAVSRALGDSLVFNAGSTSDALRTETCLPNVLHTLPSRAMLTDALGQFLARRRWRSWLVVVGQTDGDRAYARALERAMRRYGHEAVATKPWTFATDLRRSASAEMPLFTQTEDEYDVVVVADERGDFGEYLPYQTWYPRPVAGTQGLSPRAWHRTVETFGAVQLQNRFAELAGRGMTSADYAAWLGVRAIATAVTFTEDASAPGLRDALLGGEVTLDGFKGRKLTFRPWSGQLRQPIPLVHPRGLVDVSPQPGYLHPETELDTLGFDRPESRCRLLDAPRDT